MYCSFFKMPRGVSTRATQHVSCFDCNHVSTSDVMHMEHFKLQHPTLKPFKCTAAGCNKMFPTRRNLKGHMTTHEVTRPTFKCPQCPQEFLNECSVFAHVRDLHPVQKQVFKCSFEGCQFTTTAERYLATHEEMHSSTRRNFQCNQAGCDSTFFYKQSLAIHLKNHARPVDKEFKCTFCWSFQTNRQSKLNFHVKEVHNNARPHACSAEGCTETFKRPAHLREHVDRSHVDMDRLDGNDEKNRYRDAFKQDEQGQVQIPTGVENVLMAMIGQDFSQLKRQHKIDCRCLYDGDLTTRGEHWARVIVDASIQFREKKLLVLLEIDENQHKNDATPIKELRRMQDATDALHETQGEDEEERVLWVRFNPSGSFRAGSNSSSPPLAQRVTMLRDFLLEYEPPHDKDEVQVAYMFYDNDDEEWIRVVELPST